MFDDLVGKTYSEVGRCYGLCRIVCSRVGIDLPEFGEIAECHAADAIDRCRHLFVPVEKPELGDLVHIENFDGPPHVAVVVGNNIVMQAISGRRVHRMRLDHVWIRNRIKGFYRYAGN